MTAQFVIGISTRLAANSAAFIDGPQAKLDKLSDADKCEQPFLAVVQGVVVYDALAGSTFEAWGDGIAADAVTELQKKGLFTTNQSLQVVPQIRLIGHNLPALGRVLAADALQVGLAAAHTALWYSHHFNEGCLFDPHLSFLDSTMRSLISPAKFYSLLGQPWTASLHHNPKTLADLHEQVRMVKEASLKLGLIPTLL